MPTTRKRGKMQRGVEKDSGTYPWRFNAGQTVLILDMRQWWSGKIIRRKALNKKSQEIDPSSLYPSKNNVKSSKEEVQEKVKVKEEYYCHFNGWKKRFDKWVPSKLIEPYSTDLLGKTVTAEEEEKRLNDGSDDELVLDLRIKFPPSIQVNILKQHKEFSQMNREELVIQLPKEAEESINGIFEEVKEDRRMALKRKKRKKAKESESKSEVSTKSVNDEQKMQELEHVMDLLRQYFRVLVWRKLLFPAENEQSNALQEEYPATDPCDMFGVEHLLRLLIYLPKILNSSGRLQMDEDDGAMSQKLLDKIKENVLFIARYINRNEKKFLDQWQYNLIPLYVESDDEKEVPQDMDVEMTDSSQAAANHDTDVVMKDSENANASLMS